VASAIAGITRSCTADANGLPDDSAKRTVEPRVAERGHLCSQEPVQQSQRILRKAQRLHESGRRISRPHCFLYEFGSAALAQRAFVGIGKQIRTMLDVDVEALASIGIELECDVVERARCA
jgi:hypothetical protein